MWIKRFSQVFILILTVTFIVSCGRDNSSDNSSTEQNLYRSYTIDIQKDANAYAIETSIGDKELIVPNSKKLSLELPISASVQYFLVRDKYANIVLLYPLFPENNNNKVYISVNSTADALISLIPQVQILENPEAIKQIVSFMHSTPEYKQLIDNIKTYLQKDSYDKDLFKDKAIIRTLDKIAKEILPNFIENNIRHAGFANISTTRGINRGLSDMLFEVYSDNENIYIRNPHFVAYGFFPKEEPNPLSFPQEFVKPTTSLIAVDLKLWPPKIEFKDGYSNIAETKISLKTLPEPSSNYPLYIQRNLWTKGYDFINGFLLFLETITTTYKLSPDSTKKIMENDKVYQALQPLIKGLENTNLDDIRKKAKSVYVRAKEISSLIDVMLEYYNKYYGDVPYETYKHLKWMKGALDSTTFFTERFIFKALGIKKHEIALMNIRTFLITELGKSLDEIYELSQQDFIALLSNYYNKKLAKNKRFLEIWLILKGLRRDDGEDERTDDLIQNIEDVYILGKKAIDAFYEWAKQDAKVLDKILNITLNKWLADSIKEKTLDLTMKAASKFGVAPVYYTGYTTNKVVPFIISFITAPEKIKAYYYNRKVISTSPPLLENIRYIRNGIFSLEDTGGRIILNSPTDSFSIKGTVRAEGSFEFIHKNSEAWWGNLPERDVFGFRILKRYVDSKGNKHSNLVYEYNISMYNPFLGTEKVKVSEYTKILGTKTTEYSVDKYKEITNGLVDTKYFTIPISFSQEENPIGITIQYWNADSAVIENRFIPIEMNHNLSLEIIDYSECGKVRFAVKANTPLSEIQYEIIYVDENGNKKNVSGYLLSDNPNSDGVTKISLTDYGFLLVYDRSKIDSDLILTLKDSYGNNEKAVIPIPEECFEIPTKPAITSFNISNPNECITTGNCIFEANVKGEITDWLIDFGDENQATPTSLFDLVDSLYYRHKYEQSGNYTVTLKVCNDELCDEKSIKVDVKIDNSTNKPPKINFFKVEPNNGTAPLEVQFSWSISDPDEDVVTCYIDVDNDGTIDYTIDSCDNTTAFMHTYTNAGNYIAKLTATDAHGNTTADIVIVKIKDIEESSNNGSNNESEESISEESCNGLDITINKSDTVIMEEYMYGSFFVNGKIYYRTTTGVKAFDAKSKIIKENLTILNNNSGKLSLSTSLHSIYVDPTEKFFILNAYYYENDNREEYLLFLEKENSTLNILKAFKIETHITKLYINNGYLYVLCSNGVKIFDISDLSSPILLSEIKVPNTKGHPTNITICNDIGYITLRKGAFEGDLWILDLNDKESPKGISIFSLGAGEPLFVEQYKGQLLIITDGNDDNYLKFIDISDLYNPKIVAKVPLAYGSTAGSLLFNNFLVVPNYYTKGLSFIDLNKKKSTYYSVREIESVGWVKAYKFNDVLLVIDDIHVLYFKIKECQ